MIKSYMNGGQIGLWTKGDSTVYFDDLRYTYKYALHLYPNLTVTHFMIRIVTSVQDNDASCIVRLGYFFVLDSCKT